MESRIVQLRERTHRQAERAKRAILIAAGVGVTVAAIVGGFYLVRRLTRPPTTRERLQRVLPHSLISGAGALRSRLGGGFGRRVPPMGLYVGERQVGQKPKHPAWEGVALRAAKAAGTAAAGTLAARLLAGIRPRGGSPPTGV